MLREETKNILIVRLGAMGDIIHSLPGAASLKHSFPAARVSWVVSPQFAPLLEGNGFVDRLIVFRRNEPGSWRRTKDELRAERYDLAVDFQGLTKSAVIAHLARPERLAGFGSTALRERPAGLFYSTRVKSPAIHVVDQALDLAAGAGAKHLVRAFPLPQGTPEGNLPEAPFVLASPLAGWTAKQWPLEYYERLAAMLRQQLGMPLVLNGAPGTVPEVPGTLKHESGIPGLIDATRRAALVVGVDSGPLHLAAALNKAGAAIFGPTDPVRNGPYGGDFQVFRMPGARRTHRRGTVIDASMRAIPPEQVFPALAARVGCHV
ncbi:MAG TPA: glycosyltransferase family 9 protein [Bryobacteraceae bacterium]|jgi:heptosyltransferase-1|nr:glycosyltransferase family 9 protein [Bryobacteraceae bacterium]